MPDQVPRPAASPHAQQPSIARRLVTFDRPFVTGFWFTLGAMLAAFVVAVAAWIVVALLFAGLLAGLSSGF
ncbi:hypothetical protein [Candidatus Poriferisodalis sp.]|uniref:hypothetical protein n=1 Tax=Candidatus Poriferisodalis sp. TaxID=3101277 RepID=UPI003B0217C7